MDIYQSGVYNNTISNQDLENAKQRLINEPDKELVFVYAVEIAAWNSGKGGTERGRMAAMEVLRTLDSKLLRSQLRKFRPDLKPRPSGGFPIYQNLDWVIEQLALSK